MILSKFLSTNTFACLVFLPSKEAELLEARNFTSKQLTCLAYLRLTIAQQIANISRFKLSGLTSS